MSVPGNINTAPPPSSFDNNTDFYEESRWQKLRRKIVEEPLIPLGCALTCWALYEATKSMRVGDKARTNRMFRRRIYAQGFTLLAMLGGSVYWENDRAKRGQFDELSEEKKRKEKKDAWIRELEVREEEEQELRRLRDRLVQGRGAEKAGLAEETARRAEREGSGSSGSVRSVLEAGEGRADGPVMAAVRTMWEVFANQGEGKTITATNQAKQTLTQPYPPPPGSLDYPGTYAGLKTNPSLTLKKNQVHSTGLGYLAIPSLITYTYSVYNLQKPRPQRPIPHPPLTLSQITRSVENL
ncbi:hypothetical protein Q7P37_007585 [Cladosporium fusiforme]